MPPATNGQWKEAKEQLAAADVVVDGDAELVDELGMVLFNEVGQVLGEVFTGLRDEVAEAPQTLEAHWILGPDLRVLHGLTEVGIEVLPIAPQLQEEGE